RCRSSRTATTASGSCRGTATSPQARPARNSSLLPRSPRDIPSTRCPENRGRYSPGMLGVLVRSLRNRPKEGVPMAARPRQDSEVDVAGAVDLIHHPLDATLCEDVFRSVRGKERERSWTLQRLLEFWTAVVVQAPRSLTQLLEQGRRGGDGMLPH